MNQIIDPRMIMFVSGKEHRVESGYILSMFNISKKINTVIRSLNIKSMFQKIKKLEKSPKTVIAIIDNEADLQKLERLRNSWRQVYFLAVLVNDTLKSDAGLDTISLCFHGNNNYVRSQFFQMIKVEQNGLSYR